MLTIHINSGTAPVVVRPYPVYRPYYGYRHDWRYRDRPVGYVHYPR